VTGAACRAGTGGGPQTGHISLIGSLGLSDIGLAGEDAESLCDGPVTIARGVLIDHGRAGAQIQLGGQWWASWQTSRSGDEKIASQQVEIKQEGELLQVATITRGLSEEEGGYHWSGELRLWDNEILMGWYAANDGSIRSKGPSTSCCTRTA
jgi:hypothetical protein